MRSKAGETEWSGAILVDRSAFEPHGLTLWTCLLSLQLDPAQAPTIRDRRPDLPCLESWQRANARLLQR
jgi:hypothetical protein